MDQSEYSTSPTTLRSFGAIVKPNTQGYEEINKVVHVCIQSIMFLLTHSKEQFTITLS